MPSPNGRFLYHSYFHLLHAAGILTLIAFLAFDLQILLSVHPNITDYNSAYAHIFTDTENAVTKNVDGRYQVSFLPYPNRPLVNDTSTRLNFSVMENNTDVPFLFTMVISLGIDKAARHGILIKGGQYLERLSCIDTIVFDKTGTLTEGKPEVTDIIPINEYADDRYKIAYNEYKVLQLAASAESRSEHPIAQAIVRKAVERSIPLLDIAEFISFTGQGVVASYSDKTIFVGSVRKMESKRSNTKNNEVGINI